MAIFESAAKKLSHFEKHQNGTDDEQGAVQYVVPELAVSKMAASSRPPLSLVIELTTNDGKPLALP